MLPAAAPPSPAPLTAPPSWLSLLEPAEDEGGGGPAAGAAEASIPGAGWPRAETVDYLSKLIGLVVLILALPWLFERMLAHPSNASRDSAAVALGRTMGA